MAWPSSVATNADLYLAVNNLSTALNGAIGAGDTTINVADASSFPTTGIITIDLEAISYTGTTATSFTGCTRGADGTTAAAHADGATVFHDIPAAHHNVLKDELIAIENDLSNKLGTGGAAFTASRATETNGSGQIIASSVTSTELGYLSGVTSAIQTQLNAKALDSAVVHLSGAETVTGEKTFSAATTFFTGTNVEFGASGNSVFLEIYPPSAASGVMQINATDQAGDFTCILTNASQAGNRTYTIPDAGASANFVLSEGTATINGSKTFGSQIEASAGIETNDGSAANVGVQVGSTTTYGLYKSGSNLYFQAGNSSVRATDAGGFRLDINGSENINFNATAVLAIPDNTISLGTASFRWSDVRSVLINGADIGFMNGWFIREYPATFKDIQTKSDAWIKANANLGLQFVNDAGELMMVIGRDGTLYTKNGVKSLDDLDATVRARNITPAEDKAWEQQRRAEIKASDAKE